MTNTAWQPFSVRTGDSDDWNEAPYDGVPRHLVGPLRRRLGERLMEEDASHLCVRLRLTEHPGGALSTVLGMDGMELLDIVDLVLALSNNDIADDETWSGDGDGRLTRLLDEGGSAYCVSADGKALEVRLDPTVRQATTQTVTVSANVTAAGSAAGHLAAAWTAAYGLYPDPIRAYSDSIKAVECAAHAIVQANHARATLGTMIGELKGVPHKFAFVLDEATGTDQAAVPRAMMQLLWDGQTSRHGKQTPTRPETLDEARAAVHTAATLVQWLVSGTITRFP